MAIFEHNLSTSLHDVISKIGSAPSEWGVAVIKRHYLRAMTNEAFLLALRPALQGVEEAHIVYDGNDSVCLVWQGKQRVIYKLLRNLVSTGLMRSGLTVDANVLVTYIDPTQRMDEIKTLLTSRNHKRDPDDEGGDLDSLDDEEAEADAEDGPAALRVSPEQLELFYDTNRQKPYRLQLQILVVEDQVFSQKLLCEILRGVRVRNNNESPCVDAVMTVRDAWKMFLKKAPDIVFIDLNLIDGSGHALARAVKEISPQSQVIIVTANESEEEMNVARQNNVDGFITKPYNKKQILDGIARYIEATKPKGGRRASSSQL